MFSIAFLSCEDFEGEQTIPAYLKIDSIALKIVSPSQGSASSKITDAWVYIDEQLIGAFELPATIPLLYTGKHRLTIIPGIRMDGMVQLRAYYPLYNQIRREIFLSPDSVTIIKGNLINGKNTIYTTYKDLVQFSWSENFEDENLALDTTKKSNVNFMLTPEDDPATFEGLHSGKIILTLTDTIFEAMTSEAISLPRNGSPVFLEMNYRCTNTFTFGIIALGSDQYIQSPILDLNPSASWNKIYINLTPNVSSSDDALKFKLFWGAMLDIGQEQTEIYFDNMKLVYLNNQSK
ncbi:MAG TPA: hypothetical protein PLG11_00160 [Bacteroidales bacterium]|nr:hypothetical protein [Bacteroidales bacterium]HNV16266.1 hypothetical protein [Bacteroidales bacterium]HPN48021.1 hypothetical protein [Bacteroidales bacterium]HQB24336.1 hypothetical protein [Bacteroidales bacterium]HQQ41385.1 hypothetical protein [Bacteroidales bacterium]